MTLSKVLDMISPEQALPGRDAQIPVPEAHFVNGNPLQPPFPEGMQSLIVGMGCFWGAERRFWQQEGVYSTAVGYAGGYTQNASYEEVCTGHTGHTEVVLVVFDPDLVSLEALLALFWESHDPTQGMRQGNDRGSQYRSAIFVETQAVLEIILASKARFQSALSDAGKGEITTEIGLKTDFFYAEPYHQQYLAKNPGGYCGLKGTGVKAVLDNQG